MFTGSMIGSLFLVLLLMIILYGQFQSSVLLSLSSQNNEFASQVSATSRFADEILINTANQIFYDSAVTKLREGEALSNSEFIDGVRQINAITASTTIVDSIYIYNGKQDYVYSTAQYGAVNDKAERFGDQEALAILKARKDSDRLVLIPRRTYSHSGYTNTAIYSFMLFDQKQSDNAIMLNLRASAFVKLYFGSDLNRKCFIINSSGVLIASQDSIDQDEQASLIQTILENPQVNHFIYKDASGIKNICLVSSIAEHQWLYVKTLTYSEAFNAILVTRNRTVVFLSLIIIILAAVTIIISKRVYVPLKRITEKVAGPKQQSPEEVIRTIDKMMDESKNMEQFDPLIRSSFLKDILFAKRRISDPDFNFEAYHLRIVLDSPVTLYLLDSNDVSGIIDDIQQCVPYCEAAIIENSFTILFLQPTEDAQLQRLDGILDKVFVVSSPQIDSWDSIPDVFLSLKEAWQLRFLHPNSMRESIRTDLGHAIASLSEASASTIGYLKKGFLGKAEESLGKFLLGLDGKRYSTVRTAMINLGNAVIKLAYDRQAIEGPCEVEASRFLALVDGLVDIEDLKRWFETIFACIALKVQAFQQTSKNSLIDEIDAYLQENYQDISLSTKSAADHFNMSTAYISRIYRQSRNKSLMSTVNEIRIAKAKEELADPAVLIKDIPLSIGIDNAQYFFSLFKKIAGCTPKEYQHKQVLLRLHSPRG